MNQTVGLIGRWMQSWLVLQVSLVSQPEFSYNLSVQGGDITFLPGLEAFINSFVRETVLQPYILPEGYRIPLDGGSAQLEVATLNGDSVCLHLCLMECACACRLRSTQCRVSSTPSVLRRNSTPC